MMMDKGKNKKSSVGGGETESSRKRIHCVVDGG